MLKEIVLLRPLAIFLLIVYHTFACYAGAWKPFDGFVKNEFYGLIAKTNEFVPALFAFVAGFVFSFQMNENQSICNLRSLAIKKLRRLILPSIIFSGLYITMFTPENFSSIEKTVTSILSGAGHLWFLPMLFWCFILGYLLSKWDISEYKKLILLLICAILGWIGKALHLQFGLSRVLFYLIFFYGGYVLYMNKQKIDCGRGRTAALSCVCVILAALYFILNSVKIDMSTLNLDVSEKVARIIILSMNNLIRVVAYSITIHILFVLVNYWLAKHPEWQPSEPLLNINALCMGIYVIHQFVLQLFYYYTNIAIAVSPIILPWIVMALTVIISILLSYIYKKIHESLYLNI